ncbi:Ubiquitin-like protein [Dioscorea alata]|uniref:Ubiquitin-like protein n=1 Tax=Dioscorea alata TaxID=55571 RepID=A0ACB7TY75_DIOAL|nr:Ubiquitin-like protein [Dioscorea alata]
MGNVLGQQQGLDGGHEVVTTENVFSQQQGLLGSKEVVQVDDDDADYQRKGKGKSNTVMIVLNVLAVRTLFTLDVEDGKTVEQLQQMIKVEPLTVGRIALVVEGVEMKDVQRTLRDYGVVVGTEVVVLLMITVSVRGYKTTEKIIDVEVNVTDNVSELRKKLKRLKDLNQLELPDVGLFFIHNQEVMEEGRSFLSHEVKHNDTIDVFPGFVTGGED